MASSQAFEADAVWRARDVIDRALREHDFDKRERAILDVIYLATLAHETAPSFCRRIPGLKIFSAMAPEITKGNVSQIIARLRYNLVIIASPADYYGFRLPTDFWKYGRPRSTAVLSGFLDLHHETDDLHAALRGTFIEQLNNLPTHCGPQATLRPTRSTPKPDAAAGETGVVVTRESAGSGAGAGGEIPVAVAVAGQNYPVPSPTARVVPELGTSASGSQFGNPAPELGAKPRPVRLLTMVPDSGTAPSLLACNLGTNQGYKVPSTKKAPIGDDLQPCNLGQGALSGEKQDALDQMETLGFWRNDKTSKHNWLKFVRSQKLELIEELIGEVRARMNHPRLSPLRAPGAYANNKLREWRVQM